ncbi:hypothetical protein GQ457_01G017250 [Hibiscus cannabinus]
MGMAATYDQKVFCRQALIGGNYGLLSATTFIPNPDYYGALLWHRLMGSTVLAVTKESDPDLRVYAHCAKKKCTFMATTCGEYLWQRLVGSTLLAVTKESDPDLRVYAHCAKKKLTFGLNALFGRNESRTEKGVWIGDWQPQNTRDFVKYTISKGYKVDSYEFGNQLCGSGIGARVDANQYRKYFIVLKNLVKELYADPETRPKVLGTGCFYDEKFRPQSGALVSESRGAFNSGSKDVSPTFVDGFWYLDQMGMATTYDQKVFCRQALIGGNYGLLSATTFIPNPDYYGALLWHQLMGSTVLAVTKESDPYLRVYAHCAKKKPGVSVIFINLSKHRSFNITLSNLKSEDDGKPNDEFVGKQNREEYHLTSLFGKMKGVIVCLNDVPMVQPGSRDILAMDPRLVDASAPIYVVAQSIAYVTVRDFEAPACV